MEYKKHKNKTSVTVSLCMIVKNEEKFLPACLESIEKYVQQIIIVDTGSTDNTIEIAKSYGAEIYHFDWVDDFSAARNESIKYATNDWIFWMDADEQLDKNSIEEFQSCLKKVRTPVIYRVNVRSSLNNGRMFRESNAHRLFTNHFGISFTNKVHEQISPSAEKVGANEKSSNILLTHLGYDEAHIDLDKKVRRNRKLLLKMIEMSPDSAYVNYTLAQNYLKTKDWTKATNCLLKAAESKQIDPSMLASVYNVLSETYFNLNNWEKIEYYAKKSFALFSVQSGAVYYLYKLSESKKNYPKALEWLNLLKKNTEYLFHNPKSILSDTLIPIAQINMFISIIYLKQGQKEKALTLIHKSLNKSNNAELLPHLIECASNEGIWDVVSDIIVLYMSHNNQSDELLDLLGFAFIKQNRFDEALQVYLKLQQKFPKEISVIKRIASLYAKLGHLEKAQTWVLYMNKLS